MVAMHRDRLGCQFMPAKGGSVEGSERLLQWYRVVSTPIRSGMWQQLTQTGKHNSKQHTRHAYGQAQSHHLLQAQAIHESLNQSKKKWNLIPYPICLITF